MAANATQQDLRTTMLRKWCDLIKRPLNQQLTATETTATTKINANTAQQYMYMCWIMCAALTLNVQRVIS